MKKGVLRNFIKFMLRCFPMNFVKFLRTPFLQNIIGRLLLDVMFIEEVSSEMYMFCIVVIIKQTKQKCCFERKN